MAVHPRPHLRINFLPAAVRVNYVDAVAFDSNSGTQKHPGVRKGSRLFLRPFHRPDSVRLLVYSWSSLLD